MPGATETRLRYGIRIAIHDRVDDRVAILRFTTPEDHLIQVDFVGWDDNKRLRGIDFPRFKLLPYCPTSALANCGPTSRKVDHVRHSIVEALVRNATAGL